MKAFLIEIIPQILQFIKKLDDITVITNQNWIVINEELNQKESYIFRKDGTLLISVNGHVERGKWEYLNQDNLLLDIPLGSFLFHPFIFAPDVLGLKKDGTEEYAVMVNETRYGKDLNSIEAVKQFLVNKYKTPLPLPGLPFEPMDDSLMWTIIVLAAVVFIFLLIALLSISPSYRGENQSIPVNTNASISIPSDDQNSANSSTNNKLTPQRISTSNTTVTNQNNDDTSSNMGSNESVPNNNQEALTKFDSDEEIELVPAASTPASNLPQVGNTPTNYMPAAQQVEFFGPKFPVHTTNPGATLTYTNSQGGQAKPGQLWGEGTQYPTKNDYLRAVSDQATKEVNQRDPLLQLGTNVKVPVYQNKQRLNH